MKKKIRKHMMGIGILTMCIAIFMMVLVAYEILQKQVMDDLRTDCYLLETTDFLNQGTVKSLENGSKEIRITLIDPTGRVLVDTEADTAKMENHQNRPEVEEARNSGEGSAIRQSDTLKKNTYYYAIALKNGDVLRVARESHSIWSILYSALPMILLLIVFILVVCAVFSHFLTKSIIRPIEKMGSDMDHMSDENTYEELRPFIQTIRAQHEDIIKNANIRQQFTANVSHELKTPLTAISGYSELIENGMATSSDITRFASGIHQNANRLLTLINDIIRLSELDVTKEVEMEKLDLYKLAQNSVDMLKMSAENRKVTLTLDGSACPVMANRQMMEELLYNLCDNAIRYNNAGGRVWVTVQKREGRAVLEVKDTGIGIPQKHQERIFERFYRVDKSRSKQTGGTGLGLAIVKHIVAVHNAEIRLESEVGKGTDIQILFPADECCGDSAQRNLYNQQKDC